MHIYIVLSVIYVTLMDSNLLGMKYMCVTLISFIHVTTKDSSTCTTMLVLACEPATSANTSIDGRGSTTSPCHMISIMTC